MEARTPDQPPHCGTDRKRNGATTVLLTNAYGPYPNKWGKSPTDLLGARLARDNNMDGRARLYTWALYLLAENIRNPSTVLEYPRWEDFVREVRRGYDVIAIQLQGMHMARVARMMKAIRELSPATEIVIGGNGVGMLQQPLPGDKEGHAVYIRESADHLCRSEGVRFMRELLDDHPVDRPITQYTIPPADIRISSFRRFQLAMPSILVSLGCPQACEFCNTSAFYHHKKLRVATAEQVYDFMKAHQRRLRRDAITFILFDEDIFLDQEFVRELGRLIRSDRSSWGFRWISFGSVSTVSKFTPRELRECGVEGIWIGVESSIRENDRSKTGYEKREGGIEPHELFPELTRWGIQTIGSMILGFDFHTPENIENDIDYFVDLKPTLYQIGPFRPCPGTKLYSRMLKQERINEVYDWEDIHLWEEGSFELQGLQDGDLKRYYEMAHEKLRTRNGPPLLQIFECEVMSYETLANSDSAFLRYQARRALERLRVLRFVTRAIEIDAPSPRVKERARNLLKLAEPILKANTPALVRYLRVDEAIERIAPHVVGGIGIIGTVQSRRFDAGHHSPRTRWTYYNQPGQEKPTLRQARLNGKRRSSWRRFLPERTNRCETRAAYQNVISNYQDFWNFQSYAVVGHSARKRFPKLTYRGLKKKGKTVYAVDPSVAQIDSDPAYPDLESLPAAVEAVVIEVPRSESKRWVEQTVEAGIQNLWFHMFADTEEAISLAERNGINVLAGTCAVMYLSSGPSIHAIHKAANSLIRAY